MRVHSRPSCADRGSESVEVAVLAGVVLVVLLSVLQAGLWWHTRSLCHHAATIALHTTRAYGANPTAGRAAAEEFLHRAPNAATDPAITITTTEQDVEVQVAATAPHLLPLPIEFRTSQTATGARERFTTPGEDQG